MRDASVNEREIAVSTKEADGIDHTIDSGSTTV